MNKPSAIFSFSAMAALGFASAAILSNPAHAQTAKDLVGTWQHVANVNIATDGKKTDTFAPHLQRHGDLLRRWPFYDYQSS